MEKKGVKAGKSCYYFKKILERKKNTARLQKAALSTFCQLWWQIFFSKIYKVFFLFKKKFLLKKGFFFVQKKCFSETFFANIFYVNKKNCYTIFFGRKKNCWGEKCLVMWHVTHGGGQTFSQNFRPPAHTVWEWRCLATMEEYYELFS